MTILCYTLNLSVKRLWVAEPYELVEMLYHIFFLNAGCGAGGFVDFYIVLRARAGGLRSVRAVGGAGYEKNLTRASLIWIIH